MATITVTSAADDDGSTGLTLRQAISQASGGDSIEFAADFTITLDSTKGKIIIDKNLSINSLGKEVTVSGNNATAIFRVNNNVSVSINRLVLKEGKAPMGGGAIYNDGILSIINSTLSDNHAKYCGAIFNLEGTLSIINSTLSNNHSKYGGAIYSETLLSITNSTLSGNSANWGGAVYLFGSGALNISFSTIVYNQAPDGAGIYSASYENHSTRTTFKNPILANNGSNFSHDQNGWTFQAFGVNFSTDNTCPGFTQVSLDELRLGPLALNTPGVTKTHALLPGSVAIGTVADSTDLAGNGVSADQRGASRRLRDAGSYEFYPTPTRGVPLF